MTKVTIWHSSQGEIVGYTSQGHSGYGEKGSDILCASISALLQTTILGLQNLLQLDLQLFIEPDKPVMQCIISDFKNKKAESQLILKTMILGLDEISKQYPQFIKILNQQYKGGA